MSRVALLSTGGTPKDPGSEVKITVLSCRLRNCRDILEFSGWTGVNFGVILKTCYVGQIEGKFSTLEEGLEYVRTGNFNMAH